MFNSIFCSVDCQYEEVVWGEHELKKRELKKERNLTTDTEILLTQRPVALRDISVHILMVLPIEMNMVTGSNSCYHPNRIHFPQILLSQKNLPSNPSIVMFSSVLASRPRQKNLSLRVVSAAPSCLYKDAVPWEPLKFSILFLRGKPTILVAHRHKFIYNTSHLYSLKQDLLLPSNKKTEAKS